MSNKKKRFYYHYFAAEKQMIVHFEGQCVPVDDVRCRVPCKTGWRKRWPRLIMEGKCECVKIETSKHGRKVAVIC